MEGRRPVSALGTLHHGEILNDPAFIRKRLDEMNPDKNFGLGVCRVINLDYEEHFVSLRTLIGAEEFERVPVPMTYPGAGARHFLGAMPEIGDYCVVGWMEQESGAHGTKTPVILSWVIPGVASGRDWATTANFTEEEHDSGTARNREEIHGVFDRIRHKLRHIQPGNIVASSSQGSDLVLDESVTLANRRGNEFILRDADQAAILRASQQFTALCGARTYAGMVQRDALRLPTTMFSDGRRWDGEQQALFGQPVHEEDLPPHTTASPGYLTPAPIFHRVLNPDGSLSGALQQPPDYLDPYVFLRNGGYIDEDGVSLDPARINDAVYSGKNIYRVASGTTSNGVLDPSAPVLTEHRLEVAHTSDGRLPVSEQTDGFDAERLPPSDPETPGVSPNRPFLEWVLGSVVGNDPFSARGRKEYGIPLVAHVFDAAGGLSPRLEPARIARPGQSGGTPLEEHAATLFKLTPPSGRLAPTWWSVNKKGQVRVNISGPPSEAGLEAAVSGALKLAVGGELNLQLKGGIHLGTLSKNSLRLRSEEGPVQIYGGGSAKDEEAVQERLQGGNSPIPSVDIRARTHARLWAEKQVLVKGQTAEINASSVKVFGLTEVEVSASRQLSMSAEDVKCMVGGKRTDTFTGPKQLLPTNGALHERTYAPSYPGVVAEEVLYALGDRTENFLLGNHSTSILVGNMTYETELGTWSARSGLNKLEASPTGVSARALVGNITLTATAGAAQMRGAVSVLVESTGGPTVIRSNTLLRLGAPITGPDAGPVLCAGSREPFTNLPYLTWGLGAKNHLVGV